MTSSTSSLASLLGGPHSCSSSATFIAEYSHTSKPFDTMNVAAAWNTTSVPSTLCWLGDDVVGSNVLESAVGQAKLSKAPAPQRTVPMSTAGRGRMDNAQPM